MIGLYSPGNSAIHRLPAGWKLLILAVAVIVVALVRNLEVLAGAAAATVLLYAWARVPVRTALAQLRPLIWFLPFIAVFQLLVLGWRPAVVAVGILVVNVALAALFTLTTTVAAILDLCQWGLRPLRRFGVDPDRVGLAVALAIRCVPLVSQLVGEAWLARKARGVPGVANAARALAAPTVVRTLRAADSLGDALRARGFDD